MIATDSGLGKTLELDRAVPDSEAVHEKLPDQPLQGYAVCGALAHDDMGLESGVGLVEATNVRVMNAQHSGGVDEGCSDLSSADVRQGAVQQDPDHLQHHGEALVKHVGRDRDRGNQVRPVSLSEQNQDNRDD